MDVVTFGEAMISMTPCRVGGLDSVAEFEKRMAGAESNVAVGLARLGHSVSWISRLGSDPFGRFIFKTLRGEGVDVSTVEFDDEYPTGLYFKEFTASGQTQAYYYRMQSAASRLSETDVNLREHVGAKFLFVTGITPALSPQSRKMTFTAMDVAKELGMKVIFDPNIRLKLWSEVEAVSVLQDMVQRADVILPGIQEAILLTGERDERAICQRLRHHEEQAIVLKLGSRGAYYASADGYGYVDGYTVRQIDEVGAGDAFATGYISGLLDNLPTVQAVQRACAMGAIAVSGVGDYETLPTRLELHQFMTQADIIKR